MRVCVCVFVCVCHPKFHIKKIKKICLEFKHLNNSIGMRPFGRSPKVNPYGLGTARADNIILMRSEGVLHGQQVASEPMVRKLILGSRLHLCDVGGDSVELRLEVLDGLSRKSSLLRWSGGVFHKTRNR